MVSARVRKARAYIKKHLKEKKNVTNAQRKKIFKDAWK